jgi:hypothetical protein
MYLLFLIKRIDIVDMSSFLPLIEPLDAVSFPQGVQTGRNLSPL